MKEKLHKFGMANNNIWNRKYTIKYSQKYLVAGKNKQNTKFKYPMNLIKPAKKRVSFTYLNKLVGVNISKYI